MKIDYKLYIREMAGKKRSDFTLLFAQEEIFKSLVEDMTAPFLESSVTKVAALDAMGFALGGAIAGRLGTGLILLRKANKIPWETRSVSFTDYSGETKSLEIAVDVVAPNDKILIVDDWSETGSQLQAAIHLIEISGGEVVGVSLLGFDKPVIADPILASYNIRGLING
jgi:adenine phosphoribosyltransferase